MDKSNYFGYIQLGNIKFYSPETFGGSKKLSIDYYLKALEILEKKTEFIKNDWNYLSLLVNLAQAYSEAGNYETAKKYYEKALSAEPDFVWVKNDLLPELNLKM